MWPSARCRRWLPGLQSCVARSAVDGAVFLVPFGPMNQNLTTERATFVTHLECAMHGDRYAADTLHNLSKAGKPLLVRYDLAGVKKVLTKAALKERPDGLWKWRELLPVRKAQDIVSLGEDATPLISLPRLAKKLGGGEIIV